MLKETMNFLARNMKTSIIIDETGKRINRTEYPYEALREAVANALIHRDYSVECETSYISVFMYNDRVEIISPGALYGKNKLEKLGTDDIMDTRNPNIIRILEEKGSVIENRHSGIPTMKREMKKYNLPEPEFIEERNCFKVIFRNSPIDLENVDFEVVKVENEEDKNKYEEKVLEFCKEPKTSKEIREHLNLSSKWYVTNSILTPLIENGKLEYTNKKQVNARNQKYVTVPKI